MYYAPVWQAVPAQCAAPVAPLGQCIQSLSRMVGREPRARADIHSVKKQPYSQPSGDDDKATHEQGSAEHRDAAAG